MCALPKRCLTLTGFLAGYSGLTRDACSLDLRLYAEWVITARMRLFDVRRVHIEALARHLEAIGRARATIARRFGTIVCFYKYAEQEGLIEHSPAVHVRFRGDRPGPQRTRRCRPHRRTRPRTDLAALVERVARLRADPCPDREPRPRTRPPHLDGAAQSGETVTMPLAPPTARAVERVVGERFEGTILYGNDGGGLDRHAAARIVRRIGKVAGINKHIGPHTLRHGFIPAPLDAGVPLRDVQEAASHADPRITMRYDRARVSLDRQATYIVSTFIAGAAR